MTAFDDWLDGMLPPDAPMHVRRAIEKEQEGRLERAFAEADRGLRRWAVMYVAENRDLVLDMLTMLAMDGVYGRNQEERIATLLAVRLFATGRWSEQEEVYGTLDAVLSRFRTHVVPEEACGCGCGYAKPPCRTGHCDHEVRDGDGEGFCAYPLTPGTMTEEGWDDVNGMCIEMTAFDCPLREADGTDPGDDGMDDKDGRRPGI